MTVLGGIAIYLTLLAAFLAVWSRAVPRPENTSRLIDREMRRRNCGDLPRVPAEFASFHAEEISRG